MAGPGGGPPRRSHTKSRKGCETCKRRHIRCDENFPQCRNCTKHKIRCPYNDMPLPDDRSASPDKPDLLWTPEIVGVVDQWVETGIFPFPSLNIYPAPSTQFLSLEDMRLIHHVASISERLGGIAANGFTLWTRQIPTILRIGATNPYVMHSLLAFSAMHMAYLTDCPHTGNLAYEHRGIALNGLQEAISTFSRETSDAILAASLVLSWQATDWRSWTQLMQGTSSVIDAMQAWKHESLFGDFIAESSTFPTAPRSPSPDHKPIQPHQDDLEEVKRTLQQLQKVETHLKRSNSDAKPIGELINFLKGAQKVVTMSVTQQFERLRPLRDWLFWLPVLFLERTNGSPSSLVIIAHYYTVALLMERLFPEIGAAYFGSLSINPLEEIARRLMSYNLTGMQGDCHAALTLMAYPIDAVGEFRHRIGWTHPARTASFPQFEPPNYYHDEAFAFTLATNGSTEYPAYGNHPAFSYSTEDLSVTTEESGPTSAVSPHQLSSPFSKGQFLSIPSPSYGGYSPASTSFGDFSDASPINFSDGDDLSAFEDFSAPTALASGVTGLGVGLVPPVQTLWI